MDITKFNWKITGSLKTQITDKKLWKIISSPSNLELFHPFCKKNSIVKWPGKNSIDQIHYYNGLIYERKFINWIEGIGYDLLIGEKNGYQSFVSWRIQNTANSSLTISIYPYKYNTGIKILGFIPYYILVKPLLQKYINSVMQGLKYYIETNQKIQKNQFGTLNFFSD